MNLKELEKKKEFKLDDYIEQRLLDEVYKLLYLFFKSKYGRKIIKAVKKRVEKELEYTPEAFYKRETDRVINYSITFKEIFTKSFNLFLHFLKKKRLI